VDEEANAIEEIRHRRFLKAMALKESIHLTDEERHELAQLLIGVDKDDGGSWKDLDPKQLHDLITMMEGHIYISYLELQRGTTPDGKWIAGTVSQRLDSTPEE
jgi:hypothetical protein